MRIDHTTTFLYPRPARISVAPDLENSLQKLSTGLRIIRSPIHSDDTGLLENIRDRIRALKRTMKKARDLILLLNTADNALNRQSEILQRMRELLASVRGRASSGEERACMHGEFLELAGELDRINDTTAYDGNKIFADPLTRGLDIVRRTMHRESPEKNNLAGTRQSAPEPWDFGPGHGSGVWGDKGFSNADFFTAMTGAKYDQADMVEGGLVTHDSGRAARYPHRREKAPIIGFGIMDSCTLLSKRQSELEEMFGAAHHAQAGDPLPLPESCTADGDVATGTGEISGADEGMRFDIDSTGLERVGRVRSYIDALTATLESSINRSMNRMRNQRAAESVIRKSCPA